MSDPILLLLTVDVIALLLVGTCAVAVPLAMSGFILTFLSGLGLLLCVPSLMLGTAMSGLTLSVGPPGMSMYLALDPLSAFFLFIVFLAGTAIAACQATMSPLNQVASVRMMAFCLAGTALTLLAADGVSLALGIAFISGAIWFPQKRRIAMLIPLFLFAAVCLMTPAGFAPRFDAIRTAPVDSDRAAGAAVLMIAAVAGLTWTRPDEPVRPERFWNLDALSAGVLIPTGGYLLLRLIADLGGPTTTAGWGLVLLLAGGAVTVIQAWHAARHDMIDGSVVRLSRRQGGLEMAGIGLAIIARAADLPGAASLALAASFLTAIGGSVAGVLTSLAAHAIGMGVGTYRLSRLGGLVRSMPATSAALAAGLLGLSAVPPGLGFASLWLLFESILSAPRTGGLLLQLPLALATAAFAFSASLTNAGCVRLIGIAILGRPRTPLGAGAHESSRTILLGLTGLSILVGILPGPVIWLLVDPAIRALTGTPPGTGTGSGVAPGLAVVASASQSYAALPILGLLVLATGAAMLAPRWLRKQPKTTGPWTDGMAPPAGLALGEPAAQSIGEGFLPALPHLTLPVRPRLSAFTMSRPPSSAALWVLIVAFGALLVALAVTG